MAIANAVFTVIGGLLTGYCLAATVIYWRRRPLVVWSEVLARWVPARSRCRFELEDTL